MKKNGKSIQMALALLAVGTLLLNGCSAAKPAEKKSIRIGVTLYRGEDAFINNIRSSLEEKAKEYEQQTGIKVNVESIGRGDCMKRIESEIAQEYSTFDLM